MKPYFVLHPVQSEISQNYAKLNYIASHIVGSNSPQSLSSRGNRYPFGYLSRYPFEDFECFWCNEMDAHILTHIMGNNSSISFDGYRDV
jgi:hypothetical protein